MSEGKGHNPLFIALIVFVALAFVGTMTINFLANSPDIAGDLYRNTTGDLSDLYYLEITPAGWTFSIWGFIYLWQGLWLVYGLINIFRKTDQGPLYVNPVLLSPTFYSVYLVNLGLNVAWMILWDRQLIEIAFPDLFLISFTLYICLFLSYRALDRESEMLVKQGRMVDLWLVRALVHNGLGIYATWTTIATLLNLGHVMTYRSSADISQDVASTVSLAVLSVEIVIFLVTDLVFLDKYTRYTVTPYIVLVVALTGSISKNWTEGARNSIFTAALLSVAVVAAIVKAFLLFWRHWKKPMYSVQISEKDGLSA